MRMKLKDNKKYYKKRKYILLILLITILTFTFYKITTNLSYYYLNYSKREARQIIDIAISSAVTNDVLKDIKGKELYKITKNNKGEIEMVDYDSYLVNTFLRDVTDNISDILKEAEINDDKVAFYVPLGSITKNPIFSSKGPRIPVKIEIIGSILSNVRTKVKDYGINNCLIEMYIEVEVTEKVILPVMAEDITIVNEIPISYKIVTGKIPTYYGNNLNKASSIYSLPME